MEMATVRHHSYQKTQSWTSVSVWVGDVVLATPVMTDITCLLEPPVPLVLTEHVAPAPARVQDTRTSRHQNCGSACARIRS